MQDAVEHLVTLFENGKLNRQQLIQGLLAALAPLSMGAHAQADTSTTSTFRGRTLNHVTLSVTDVERSQAFYSRLLGGTLSCGSVATQQGKKIATATLDFPDSYISLYPRGEPRVHHFCVGVEHFAIDEALEKLRSDFPGSKPTVYRGEELYFRDPDGILGQISAMDYRGQRKTP
jgi:catechol 2,3-dioxygenase-like lactoylglutathione lyase family enzyme